MWVQVETVDLEPVRRSLGRPSRELPPAIASHCGKMPSVVESTLRCPFQMRLPHRPQKRRGGRGLRPSLDPRSLADQRLATRDGQSALARALDRSRFTYFVL